MICLQSAEEPQPHLLTLVRVPNYSPLVYCPVLGPSQGSEDPNSHLVPGT